MQRQWKINRFDAEQEEPLGPLANLLDLMLVFACGLIAALIGMSENVDSHFQRDARQVIEKGTELPNMPGTGQTGADGYEPVGQVYRDPSSGKLILIGQ